MLTPPVVRCATLRVDFRSFTLGPLDLSVPPGRLVLLRGPNAAGKSTLLDVLAGLRRPDDGVVTICGQCITDLDSRGLGRLRREFVAYAPQVPSLLDFLTVDENLRLVLAIRRAEVDAARSWLERFGLQAQADLLAGQLSAGQRALAALVPVLADRTPVLLLDEPTAALDEARAALVWRHIVARVEAGTVAVVATHDVPPATDKTLVLELRNGQLLAEES